MSEQRYTVLSRDSDGDVCIFYSSFRGPDYRSLDGLIRFVCEYEHRGVVHVPVAWLHGEDIDDELIALRESIAAGRTIELIDGKYVPRGVAVEEAKPADAGLTTADARKDRFYDCMSDRLGLPRMATEEGWSHFGRKVVLRADPRLHSGGQVYFGIEDTYTTSKVVTKTPTLDKLANTAEPKRPALDWNKPTPFDPFKGFTVLSSTTHQETQPRSALTTLGDPGDFKHASAFLKG